MGLRKPAKSANATLSAVLRDGIASDPRSGLQPRRKMRGIARDLTSGTAMADVMRTVVWITGVAFGITAPATFAQEAQEGTTARISPAFQKLDVNHDGFISRGEAKQNASVDEVFSQAYLKTDEKI